MNIYTARSLPLFGEYLILIICKGLGTDGTNNVNIYKHPRHLKRPLTCVSDNIRRSFGYDKLFTFLLQVYHSLLYRNFQFSPSQPQLLNWLLPSLYNPFYSFSTWIHPGNCLFWSLPSFRSRIQTYKKRTPWSHSSTATYNFFNHFRLPFG